MKPCTLLTLFCAAAAIALCRPCAAQLAVSAHATLVDPPAGQNYNTGDPDGASVGFSSGSPTDVNVTGGIEGERVRVQWSMELEYDQILLQDATASDLGGGFITLGAGGSWIHSASLSGTDTIPIGTHTGTCYSDIYILNISLSDTKQDDHSFVVVFE